MDVKYISSDWRKMQDAIGDLIGLGRRGEGIIGVLKDISDNFERVQEDIEKYDSDSVISFDHTSRKGECQELYEDFLALYKFASFIFGSIISQ